MSQPRQGSHPVAPSRAAHPRFRLHASFKYDAGGRAKRETMTPFANEKKVVEEQKGTECFRFESPMMYEESWTLVFHPWLNLRLRRARPGGTMTES